MKERGNPRLKRLDGLLGRPLVVAFGLWAWARRMSGTDQRRLASITDRLRLGSTSPVVFTLLKSAAIGDTVLMSAVVRDLRRMYPNSIIRMACGRSNREAAGLIDDLDEVVTLPMTSPLGIVRVLPAIRADVLLDFDSWPRINALIAAASRSSVTVGFRTNGQHRHFAYTQTVDHDPTVHELDNYRRLVGAVSAWTSLEKDFLPSEPTLRIPSNPARLPGLYRRYAVIHMFAGGSQSHAKEWPQEHWRALVDCLQRDAVHVYFSGGPTDAARNRVFAASLERHERAEVLDPGSLASLVARLAEAAVVVAVDTGVAHLAAATGAPTIVLHGPTSPRRWGARGPRVHYLEDGQIPWISLGFERSPVGRQMHVDPAQAMALVSRLLTESASQVQSA